MNSINAETIDLTNDSDGELQSPYRHTRLLPQKQVLPNVNQLPPRRNNGGGSRVVRRSRHYDAADIIILDSSSDIEEVSRPAKRTKLYDAVDSEEEYCSIHAAFDLDNITNWKSHTSRPETAVVDEPRDGNFAIPPFKVPYTNISTNIRESTQFRRLFIWDKLTALDTYRRHHVHRGRNGVLERHDMPRSTLQEDVCLNDLKLVQTFSHSPGSVYRIEQKEGWVALGSGVIGGLPDHIDRPEDRNPYNRPGSLIVWNHPVASDPSQYIMKGHFSKFGNTDNTDVKYYAIHDIKFDPCNNLLVTSGSDFALKIWEYDPDGFPPDYEGFKLASFKRSRFLHDLAFKPGTSVLAVAEKKLHVIHDILGNPHDTSFMLAPEGVPQSVGAIAWGTNSSKDLLFASSEPLDGNQSSGYHKVFDVVKEVIAYVLDAQEAGDSLVLNNSGSILALTTRNDNEYKNWLRLYDARRQDTRALLMTDLEKFPNDLEGEVNSVAFSPDDIYLALGRNDNQIHVYDRRMSEKLLYRLEHTGASRVAPGCKPYGITKIQWVQSYSGSRLGLITGGEDGCVRLWDTLGGVECPDGDIIAEAQSDIAYFSLGDRYKGEQPLVIGDCTGAVSIFNSKNIIESQK